METFDLLIIFNTQTGFNSKIVKDVENYGYFDDNNGMFYFRKNGYDAYIPKENVVFIGRDFDW